MFSRNLARVWILATSILLLCCVQAGATRLDPAEFEFHQHFYTILQNMLDNHWRDEGGPNGGLWLNRDADPEVYYGKGDGSLFGTELLYMLGLDEEISDEELPLPKTELVHRANRTVDHIIRIYRNLFVYLSNPDRYYLEVEELGTALPGLVFGLQNYTGELNAGFSFNGNLSLILSLFNPYARIEYEGNLLGESDLGYVGALGMTAYYDFVFARIAGEGGAGFLAAQYGFSQIGSAERYKVVEQEPGHEGHLYYLHSPELIAIDAYANPMMLMALAMAYQFSGKAEFLDQAIGLADALHDHLWDHGSHSGYFYDEYWRYGEIHLAPNNCVVMGLLHLYDAYGDQEGSRIYLDRARNAIQGVLGRLYSDPLRVCLHDDVAWVDPTYYCTGCNLHLLRNIYEFNRLVQVGPRGPLAQPFPVLCGQLARPEDPLRSRLMSLLVVLLLPVLVTRALRASGKRRREAIPHRPWPR